MFNEPEFWVAVAFVIFVAGLGYLGVHRMIPKSPDERAGRIQAELDEARKLKDDAAQLLAEYQRKRQEAEGEAQEIIAGAKAEAERLAVEAKVKIEEFVARRTKMAETKIAQAEAQAAADARSAADEGAVPARRPHPRRRSRRRRRGEGAEPGSQGQARRRTDRQGH